MSASASSGSSVRFLQRLPQFITLFFSLTMVNAFRLLADTYSWPTGPQFDLSNSSHVLIALSFSATLFWIVTAWLGYSLLTERYPYTLDLYRFLFDVVRFSMIFALMNLAFLAGRIESYHNFILTLGLWHALMAGWYLWRLHEIKDVARHQETQRDAASHGMRFATYLILGVAYYFGVATRVTDPSAEILRYIIVAATLLLMMWWNIRRIRDFKERLVREA